MLGPLRTNKPRATTRVSTRSQSGARKAGAPTGKSRTGQVRWLDALVHPDQIHPLFSPLLSTFRTSRLPTPTNNNKTVGGSPHSTPTSLIKLSSSIHHNHHSTSGTPTYILHHHSRKRSSSTLPPLSPGSPRTRRGHRVTRTVPSSRAASSRLLERGIPAGKRSRSASQEPPTFSPSPSPHKQAQRLAKVETVRVLRARSALLLPLSSPNLSPLTQPLVLKSEDRKKKKR